VALMHGGTMGAGGGRGMEGVGCEERGRESAMLSRFVALNAPVEALLDRNKRTA
jgi:hypothetical protein